MFTFVLPTLKVVLVLLNFNGNLREKFQLHRILYEKEIQLQYIFVCSMNFGWTMTLSDGLQLSMIT
jgi:hypothetical protein